MPEREDIIKEIAESVEVKQALTADVTDLILKAALIIIEAYNQDKKVLFIGNGGSAADAQHLAT